MMHDGIMMMMPSSCRFGRAAATRLAPHTIGSIRTHMNHGGGDLSTPFPIAKSGPREALTLGLDSARATQNILRLLESSAHGVVYADTIDAVWHSSGLVWQHCTTTDTNEWKAVTPAQQQHHAPTTMAPPRLEWLSLSDDRTALAKIQGMDGTWQYVSMLRLDSPNDDSSFGGMVAPHDGWQIVRQVVGGGGGNPNDVPNKNIASIGDIYNALTDFLAIEHGGGKEDRDRAESLFAPQASLLTVGTAPLDQAPTDWSAPAGTLLEINLDTYLQGIESQTPRDTKSKVHDGIVQVDVLAGTTAAAAAATVHVGNGAQTTLFVDHLLLGYSAKEKRWKILSKVFTPRAWPQCD